VRNEVLTGIDSSTLITVSPASSILNRALKFLIWLSANYPNQIWSQYYNGTNIIWDNIIVAGHSQGSGFATLIGMRYGTTRVIQYGGTTDYYNTGVAPLWTQGPSQTPKDRFVGFRSKYEFICLGAAANWVNLQMPNYGAVVDVTSLTNPFVNSHMLCTPNRIAEGGQPLGEGLLAHFSYIVDGYLPSGNLLSEYQSAWTYLATIPSCLKTCVNSTYCANNGSCVPLSSIFTEPSDPCLCQEGALVNGAYIAWVVIVVVVAISLLIAVPIILICRSRPSPCESCYTSCPRCCTFWGDCGKGSKSGDANE